MNIFQLLRFPQQIILAFSVGTILLTVVSSFVISSLSSNTVRKALVKNGKQITENFAKNSTLALLYESPENANEAARETLEFPNIKAIGIYDLNGKALLALEGLPKAFKPKSSQKKLRLEYETDSAWCFVAPVFTGNTEETEKESPFMEKHDASELAGYVRVLMSKSVLHKTGSDIKRNNFTISLVLASLMLVTLLFITSRLTNPLQNLAETMRRAQQGKKKIYADVGGSREVTEMGKAFNTMMGVLEAREKRLRESEERFRSLVNNVPGAIYRSTVDDDREMKFLSSAINDMSGYSASDFINDKVRSFASIIHPDDRDRIQRVISEKVQENAPYTLEYRFRHQNGEVRWAHERGRAAYNESGTPLWLDGALVDITENKKVQQELGIEKALLRNLIDSIPDLIFIKNMAGDYLECNKAFASFLGVPKENLVGNTGHKLIPQEMIEFLQEKDPITLQEGKAVRFEKWVEYFEGKRVLLDTLKTAFSTKGGEILGVLGISRDITELHQYREHLEERVRERTTELSVANQRLQRAKEDADAASNAKSDFLANMSHEIRTPMNAIIGMIHLALKTELTPKQSTYLTKIHSSTQLLLHILNDILDFSKIEAGKLEMESVEFSLEEVFETLSDVVSLNVQKKGLEFMIKLAPEAPNHLIGDPMRLSQILTNLVSNAIKFTNTGEIVVAVELLKKELPEVVLQFSVRDTGVGLNREQLSELFDAFTQADSSTTRKYGGTGLGLAICKRLVNMMAGKIWVESEPGTGSIFYFTATCKISQESPKKTLEIAPDLRGLWVLVVDDNQTSLEIVREILVSFHFNVTIATCPQDAFKSLEDDLPHSGFDLVIVDWNMPGMNGIEAAKLIKGNPQRSKIPAVILMVEAYAREEVTKRNLQKFVDGVVIKPFSPSSMFDTMIKVFHHEHCILDKKSRAVEQKFKGHILLVEDNEINLEVASALLAGTGLQVTVARNGKEAVEKVKERRFDAVLMDIQMPVMDGFQATDEIRNNLGYQDLPIIAMTANTTVSACTTIERVGMNDAVFKPIDPEHLFATLGKWICNEPKTKELSVSENQLIKTVDQQQAADILPVIDFDSGVARVGGNHQLFQKLLRKFLENHADFPLKIQQALRTKDNSEVKRLVHMIKGVSGNISACRLESVARDFEKVLNTNQSHDIKMQQDRFTTALEEAMVGIKDVLKNLNSVEQSKSLPPKTEAKKTLEFDRSKVELLFTEIRQLLETHNVDALDYLDQIRKQLKPEEGTNYLLKLEKALDCYDFENAQIELSMVAKRLNLSTKEKI